MIYTLNAEIDKVVLSIKIVIVNMIRRFSHWVKLGILMKNEDILNNA